LYVAAAETITASGILRWRKTLSTEFCSITPVRGGIVVIATTSLGAGRAVMLSSTVTFLAVQRVASFGTVQGTTLRGSMTEGVRAAAR
jgi:hypothetical protein